MSQRFCPKCKKTMDEIQFYTYKNGEKCEQCKKCQTMHIDNYDPETFLWLLEKMDVPYIPQEWNTLRDRAAAKSAQTKKPLTGMSVYGKYLSKMKLKQWKDYGWADTERLTAERELKMQGAAEAGQVTNQEILDEMFKEGKISKAEYDTLSMEEEPVRPEEEFYPANSPYEQVDIPIVDLTEEDKIYLAMKWGRLYRPDQWVYLEQMYTDMQNSFQIGTAAREDTLKKICKTSLKMDEAIDCGDFDVYQKLTRVYDALMKSGKFSEAQNKDTDSGFINSVGELVALCEKEGGFIPRWDVEVDQDKLDYTIKDINNYLYKLVTKDMGLGQQIEDAIKNIEIQKEMEAMEEAYSDDVESIVFADADYEELYEEEEAQKDIDAAGEIDGSAGSSGTE